MCVYTSLRKNNYCEPFMDALKYLKMLFRRVELTEY